MRVLDLRFAVPPFDILRDGIHRSRTVERDRSDNIVDAVGAKLGEHPLHSFRLELKNTVCAPFGNQSIRLRIIKSYLLNVKIGMLGFDEPLGIGDDRQVPQTEKVKFNKSEFRRSIHVKLRNDRIAVDRKRNIGRNLFVCNDHTGSMRGSMPRHALERTRCVDQPCYVGVAFVQRFQFPSLQRIAERNTKLARHKICDLIDLGVAHTKRSPDIADRCTRCHRTESHDLRNMLGTVMLGNIADDLVSPLIAKIHINIGHADTFGVEESLKQQIKSNGIYIGDPDKIVDKAAGARTSARSDRNAMIFCIGDIVSHNQNIIGKAHLFDDRQLIFRTRNIVLFCIGIKGNVPFADLLFQAVKGIRAQ